MLGAAVWVIWHEARSLSPHDIMASLRAIPTSALWAGVGATVLSYIVLAFYDILACRSIKAQVGWPRAAFAAFCSYVLSHNLGCSAISGAAVRYRLYQGWGVGGQGIASIIAFCSIMYILGLLGLVGFLCLTHPHSLPHLGQVPTPLVMMAGLLCVAVLGGYIFIASRQRELRWGRWRLTMPSAPLAVGQIAVSMADMTATALIAWCVLGPLPEGSTLTFCSFLAIYLASYSAGLLASVPGGLGVFESTLLIALGGELSASRILGSALVFRLFYYVVPLFMAGGTFGFHELWVRLRGAKAIVGPAARAQDCQEEGACALPAPQQAAAPEGVEGPPTTKAAVTSTAPGSAHSAGLIRQSEATFSVGIATGLQTLLGCVLALYAVLAPPATHVYRHSTAGSALWMALGQGGDFLLFTLGIVLVALATGLHRRIKQARLQSLGVLVVVALLVPALGAPWQIWLADLGVFVVLLPFGPCYYRKPSWRAEPFSLAHIAPLLLWLGAIALMTASLLSHHVGALWWQALTRGADSTVGRWCLGLGALGVFGALWGAMRRSWISPVPWDSAQAQHCRQLRDGDGLERVMGLLGLRPDAVLYDDDGRAAMLCAHVGPYLVLVGPVGRRKGRVPMLWRACDYALQEQVPCAYVQDSLCYRPVCEDLGAEHAQPLGQGLFLFQPLGAGGQLAALLKGRIRQRVKVASQPAMQTGVVDTDHSKAPAA
ncbi:lysylphosphatidylglycerol synthase domain-containing protein [Formicincola oecophyllae]|uniref:lysylphosphatidylglycerol synthase domain-containing protein n=1 Tax=Formicincola oecophyllae TaxID=2558361 RepID=UPI00257432FA|nr:lysylphosphatidylglycerol synthase domain-containing protein [Formicincola oecophyllae]